MNQSVFNLANLPRMPHSAKEYNLYAILEPLAEATGIIFQPADVPEPLQPQDSPEAQAVIAELLVQCADDAGTIVKWLEHRTSRAPSTRELLGDNPQPVEVLEAVAMLGAFSDAVSDPTPERQQFMQLRHGMVNLLKVANPDTVEQVLVTLEGRVEFPDLTVPPRLSPNHPLAARLMKLQRAFLQENLAHSHIIVSRLWDQELKGRSSLQTVDRGTLIDRESPPSTDLDPNGQTSKRDVKGKKPSGLGD